MKTNLQVLLVTIHLAKSTDEEQAVPLKLHLNRTFLTRFKKSL